jgi:hypothetical protein
LYDDLLIEEYGTALNKLLNQEKNNSSSLYSKGKSSWSWSGFSKSGNKLRNWLWLLSCQSP